ncbi:1-acylglycerol-3-phosphate O-acyltransferase ABHD5 [Sinocyclocheilus grahami]|uniref:1-acylglycerol-3-phosphate O-acyltransferase ABHD5 n=1 Tax=Sinocyclocheilus grahami TaxID=75366 RepID=UPI0007AD2905|nr:PREDICTED: 1-acylglycerol-3-phosphate O-acyltransferase ABHD5-like [Sinocyclocheilus grahami]
MRTDHQKFILAQRSSGWISSWLPSWCPTSLSHLIKAEDRILKPIKVKFTQGYVPISNGNYIWTLGFNERESSPDLSASGVQHHQVPLVLLHGFGGGVGLWVKNLPALAQEGRAFFALVMLGFGRSSRPTFGRDAEEQFVQALEDWRKAEGLEHMILLGHDLGGYVSTTYALKYPHRLKHLVLVEPWGFAARPNVKERWVPIWIQIFGAAMNPFNPLGPLRLAGLLGPLLLQLLRADFKQKFASVFAWKPRLLLEEVIQGAGHYIFADQSEDFNQTVLKICNNFRHIINGEEYNQ